MGACSWKAQNSDCLTCFSRYRSSSVFRNVLPLLPPRPEYQGAACISDAVKAASPPSQAGQEMKAEIERHWRKGGKHALVMGDSVAEEFGDYLRDDLGIKVLFGKQKMRASAPEDHALQVSDSFREIRDDVDVKNAGVILRRADRLAVDGDNDVAGAQHAVLRRRVGDVGDERAVEVEP